MVRGNAQAQVLPTLTMKARNAMTLADTNHSAGLTEELLKGSPVLKEVRSRRQELETLWTAIQADAVGMDARESECFSGARCSLDDF